MKTNFISVLLKSFLTLWLVVLLPFGAQSQHNTEQSICTLFNLTWRESSNPLFLQKIDSIQHIAEEENDRYLLAYILMIKQTCETTFAKSPQEKEKCYKQLEDMAENSPYLDIKGYYFFWKGLTAFYNKEYAKALPWIFQAKKILEQAHYDDFCMASYYYNGFFDVYYYFEDYKMAAYYCEMAIKKPNSDIYSHHGVYNNLGLCYLKLKDFDKAENVFIDGINLCKKEGNLNFEALIRGNLGNSLRLKGNYKEALPLLYEEAKTNEINIPENAAISRFYIANSLLHLDSVEKARSFLKPLNFQMPIWTYPSYDLIRLETMALYHSKINNFQAANCYKDSLIALKDTLKVQLDYKKIMVLESNLQAQKYINEREEFEIKAQNERFRRNLIIAVLVLLFGGIIYWFNQRRRIEKQLQQQKHEHAEGLLASANNQLLQYISNIKEKNELIDYISQQLEEANTNNTFTETEKKGYLENLQNSVILTEENWTEFKSLFEQVFPHFFTNLNKQYQDLTAAEIRLLALEKLNLPDKAIGNILGISADSVKKTRYRLRKKYPKILDEV